MTPTKPPRLHGIYARPAVKRGQWAHCLIRNDDVIVTGWTDAPLSWPRGHVPSTSTGGGIGLVVTEELARAIKNESARAVCYWWGIGRTTVAKWRKKLEVTKHNNEGTHLLVAEATEKNRQLAYQTELSPEEHERRSKLASSLRLWETSPRVTYGVEWTPESLALLGTMPDPEVARRTGHTLNAVHLRRRLEGIPAFKRRRDGEQT
jgi:transposase-like protein